jgi:HEAT repeat protein
MAIIEALASNGRASVKAIPGLIRRRAEDLSPLSDAAARALDQIDPDWPKSEAARGAIPELVGRLDARSLYTRQAALETLGRIGPAARQAGPAIARRLGDAEDQVPNAAVESLRKLGPTDKETLPKLLPELVKHLTGNSCAVREATADVLAGLGADAKPAVPDLVKRLADNGPEVRQAAEAALARIDPQWADSAAVRALIPELVRQLDDPAPDLRETAAEALGRIGPAANRALAHLQRKLDDGDRGVKKAAAEALRKIEAKEKPAAPVSDRHR